MMTRRAFGFGALCAFLFGGLTLKQRRELRVRDAYTRLSTTKGDPGYAPWCDLMDRHKRIRIWFDGRRAEKDVTLVDSDIGMIERGVRNEKGDLTVVNGEIAMERLYGDVLIVVDDHPRAVA